MLEQRVEIENEVGDLQWLPLEEKKSARIVLEARLDPSEDENRQAVLDWFSANTQAMYGSFKNRVAGLRAEEL